MSDGFRSACKQCTLDSQRKYREANPEKISDYYRKNRERVNAYRKLYVEKNRERLAEWSKNHRQSNAESERARCKAHYARNKQQYYDRSAKRRTKVKGATPTWSNLEIVRSFYKAVSIFNSHDGLMKFSVDHVVPLNNAVVSGLHAHTNLTIIPLLNNLAKGNRHWPDMP